MAGLLADYEALFGDLAAARGLLLAVSGGPDSIALLLLVDRWRRGRDVPVAVATVDHGLRAGSADEAVSVAELCKAHGLPHYTLRWTGEKPDAAIQEKAREARYRLLSDCAEAIGADTIVTGHHADDQAETILMRLTRGSGIAGLAGMANVSQRGNLRLARPLLGVTKADLVALCRTEGVSFVEDPGNIDARFRRVALRALGDTLVREGLDGGSLRRLGRRAARAEAALRWAEARAADALPIRIEDDVVLIEAASLAALPAELVLRVLAQYILRSGSNADIRLERLEVLESRLRAAIEANTLLDATLGGCTIRLRHGDVCIATAPARRSARAKSETASARRYLSSAPLLGNAGGDA